MKIIKPIQGPSVTFNRKELKRAIKAFGLKGTIKRYSDILQPEYTKKMINLILKNK